MMDNSTGGRRIRINGVVQGVGFRPFVYSLAKKYHLNGWVRNTSAGVDIEVNGDREALEAFIKDLQEQPPPLAQIDKFQVEECAPDGYTEFSILLSEPIPGAFQPISPDISICPDCLRELFDPQDRHYRYPFVNCTNCGPRFTIIKDIPYDRPQTTMAPFEMCPDCAEEYHNPLDRRFHAQPVACPACGPKVWLEVEGEILLEREEAIQQTRALLREGKVLAIKGLGGFHLACDATNPEAVGNLRARKLRVEKPFAVMMPSLETVRKFCQVNEAEAALLTSRERPIVILERLPGTAIVPEIAPHQNTLGVMLPYTPLHYLLLEEEDGFPPALVMTSGNLSEEPIANANQEARQRLSSLADAFLMHNREIQTRCDDSVMRSIASNGDAQLVPLRRSRGYAPYPVHLPWNLFPILAAGGELKNTFCLTRDHYAFLSHHIGDLENYETLQAFQSGIAHIEHLFRIHPEALAYDLHPDYMATRYAQQRGMKEDLPAIGIQHHHAHIAACMAEHSLPEGEPVIGVAFDGTGYGTDGAIWGGEFLIGDYTNFERALYLDYIPLPGGDKAVRQPARLALAWLDALGMDWPIDLPSVSFFREQDRDLLKQQIRLKVNAPLTSSMGRLFDAAAALSGVRQAVNYEAQAAIEFEALVDPQCQDLYPFEIEEQVINPAGIIHAIVEDKLAHLPINIIAAKFHNTIAHMVVESCIKLRDRSAITRVVLSGGVWQNMVLLERSRTLLEKAGFEIFTHRKVPANDGGLALGQAIIAYHSILNP
jgi:hydrogenase maturation protein HypF